MTRVKNAIILVLFTIVVMSAAAQAAPWKTIVVGKMSEMERLAAVDFQRYLGQVTGAKPMVVDVKKWQKHPVPAVVIGTPDGNPLLKGVAGQKQKLGDQGFYLANSRISGVDTVIAAGITREGATNAMYSLLRELGYGFYLGDESVPAKLPARLPGGPIMKSPVFKIRGVLPWYNFFNSPTTWDPIDHRAFVDQLIRMGANCILYHTYNYEPFAAYKVNGKMEFGKRLLNTGSPTWGTQPLAAKDFGFGTDKLFKDDYFGAETTLTIKDDDQAIQAEQDVMRDAIDYAKRRGVKMCLGFQTDENPLDPKDRESFLKRFSAVLDQYPSLDYIVLWQSEGKGAHGHPAKDTGAANSDDPESMLTAYSACRRAIFKRITDDAKGQAPHFRDDEYGRIARARESARLEQICKLAWRALAHRQNAPKLILSGWGGEIRCLSAEYYEGLDKLLPKDVVFSSLDNIVPLDHVDSIYNQLPPDRERWPIPWLEYDGDQWQPQPFVHIYEKMVRNAHKGGSQGILGIHWRTRDITENFSYLIDYAWNPELTAEGFFKDYAKRCYAPAIADKMAAIHSELDNMGYRWVAGTGQGECGNFLWCPGDPSKAEKLRAVRYRAAALLPMAGNSRARVRWMLNRMDWTIENTVAEIAAYQAQTLIQRAKAEQDVSSRKAAAEKALAMLDDQIFGQALRTFALRVTTRGEYGVLATINTKAVVSWRDLQKQARELLGRTDPGEQIEEWNPDPQILLPRFIASAQAGAPLEMFPIVFGGKPAWMHYRPLGTPKWSTQPMKSVKGWVCRAVVPAAAMVQPGVEIKLSFSSDPKAPASFGPTAVTAMPKTPVNVTPPSVIPAATATKLDLKVQDGDILPLELTWNDVPEADYYKVYRNGAVIAEPGTEFFPDGPKEATGEYRVEAWRDGKVIASSKAAAYALKQQSVEENFKIDAFVHQSGVILRWPASKLTSIARYIIWSDCLGGDVYTVAEIPASHSSSHLIRHVPRKGRVKYVVVPVGYTGMRGRGVETEVTFQPSPNLKPVIDLPLDRVPEGATVTGKVNFTKDGAAFYGGYIEIPHNPVMHLKVPWTLEFEYKADSSPGMSLLLCHGSWTIDGWYVQLSPGVTECPFSFWTPSITLSVPPLKMGEWHSFRLIYDESGFTIFTDGKKVLESLSEAVVPAKDQPLVLGQYVNRDPIYEFKGMLRNVRIYNDAVLP